MSHNKNAQIFKRISNIIAILLVIGVLFNSELQAGIKGFDYVIGKIGEHPAWNQSKIPVLMYHHILGEDEMDFSNKNQSIISEHEFAEQMKFLSDSGFKTISSTELYEFLLYKKPFPSKSVFLTFDDGYQSNFVYAYPILKKYGFRATIFMISSMIQDSAQKFNPEKISFLSWDEINRSKDVFEFQSHTHSLHFLDKDQKSHLITVPSKQIESDLLLSKNLLSASALAYPYGQFDFNTVEILKDAGYKMAFTNFPYYVTTKTDVYRIPRFSVTPGLKLDNFERIIEGKLEN